MQASNSREARIAAFRRMKERRVVDRIVDAGIDRVRKRIRWASKSFFERSSQPLRADGTHVEVAKRLTQEMLVALSKHEIAGIHIRGFASSDVASSLADALLEQSSKRWQLNTEGGGLADTDFLVGVGMPLTEGFASEDAFVRYLEQAVPSVQALRSTSSALLPFDRLRLELDELWPWGAKIAAPEGHKYLPVISRIQKPDTLLQQDDGVIHIDSDLPLLRPAGTLTSNIYLRIPKSGGELLLWNVAPTRRDLLPGFDAWCQMGSYSPSTEVQQRIRALLPDPIRISPAAGDLVMFNPARPHSVRGFTEGERVSLQSFIRYAQGASLEFSI